MKQLNVRALAAQISYQVVDQGQSLSTCLPTAQKKLSTQDQAFLAQLCYGLLRYLPQLDKLIRDYMQQPLKGKQRVVHHILLVGVYQLYFMRVAPHAALSETVEACKQLKHHRLTKLVNGVLRNLERQRPDLSVDSPTLKFCHPKWLIEKIKQAYPQDGASILEHNNQQPPMWLRNNTQYQSRLDYLEQLKQVDIEATVGESADSILLAHPVSVSQLPQFQQGAVSVQDGAAQWAAHLLDPQPNDVILDACAAPGGKTCHLLEKQPQLTKVIALDKHADRLERVQENLQRLNLHAQLVEGDASDFSAWHDGSLFDRILLDAPCSATGVIRRHPDIKWLRQAEDIENLVMLQADILDACWLHLKKGGTLLYATCSVLPQENKTQIENFLSRTPDAKLIAIDPVDPKSVGWQIIPDVRNMDGFYYAKLFKV
tara:strand:- start:16283 stop:17569 length:1287 start_codon:yes stop_codon:yes gene_type:complete